MRVSISNAGDEAILSLEADNVGEQAAIATFVGLLGGAGHDVLQVLDAPTRIESVAYADEPGEVISGISFAVRKRP